MVCVCVCVCGGGGGGGGGGLGYVCYMEQARMYMWTR